MMARFLDGINLDLVARCDYIRDKYHCYALDGTLLGTTMHDPAEYTAPVVPASWGQTALVLKVVANDASPPQARPDEIWINEIIVVAWRLCRWSTAPILIEEPLPTASIGYRNSDGSIFVPDEGLYPNINVWREDMLKSAQAEWDRNHPPTPAEQN